MKLFDRIYQWSIHPSRGIEGFIVFVWLVVLGGIVGLLAVAVPIGIVTTFAIAIVKLFS